MATVEVVCFTDPSCPWAYSAEPFMRALEWRYGDGLRWRRVMIGLREDTADLEQSGVTPARRVDGWRWFADTFGMPILTTPRARLVASGRACRAVKAAALQGEQAEVGMLRAVRLAWFTTTLLLDEDDALAEVAAGVDAIDAGRLLADMPAAEDAYRADTAEARAARGIGEPAIAQGRAATSNGDARFTAPSLLFRRDGQTLVAGGWQSFEAYDVCVANLAPELDRRPEPQPAELLAAFPAGLTTAEVAEVCRGRNDPRDIPATRAALERLRESGAATGTPLGDDDVLWRPRA
ncbi:MAG TPA: DsbA family protein [Gaiellales bacterium]|jgi:2-hydroxychromene-2-carboxylate isomerase|nr:DsbA family protein [Gaiellales bacterium]